MSAAKLTVDLPDECIDAIAELVLARLQPPEDYIGVEQAAAYLACSKHRIYRLVSRSAIPYRKEGARVLFSRRALDDWLEAQSP